MMNRRILWMTAALMALAACEKSFEEPVAPEPAAAEEDAPWIFKDQPDLFTPADGTPMTLRADYGNTRAHIDMNAEGTYAQAIWKKNDKFRLYGFVGTGGQYADFTASQDGASVDFSTNAGFTVNPSHYTALFPIPGKNSTYNGQKIFGVTIPAEQEAVPGGIKDGYTAAYAVTPNTTDLMHFQSVVSLVRFRMGGDIVPEVKSVTIKGASTVAGDLVLVLNSDGTMSYSNSVYFTTDVQSSTVKLTGNFEAGQDYYLVLKPGAQNRFQMVFSDDAGHSTTKTANSFTFPQGRISDFGTIALGDAFEDDNASYTPIPYMTATAGAPKPVTIAVIPEGFTKAEMSTYEMLAKSGIDALMNTEPFNSYREYFNVWILRVPSTESGASITDGNGTITTPKNTYFGARWGEESYNDMVADGNTVYGFVTENCPDIVDGLHRINEVPILMIINDARYGGICHSNSSGKGYCMSPYSYEGGTISWRYASTEAASATATPQNTRSVSFAEKQEMGLNDGNWLNTLVHEFGGHCFSRLADEYWYNSYLNPVSAIAEHSWPTPYGLNISATYDNPGWKADLLGDDLQVKPSLLQTDSRYGRIGVYQGGDVSMFNRWRSERISCMIDNRFYFSTWQRIIIVKRIMTLSGSTFDINNFWAKDDPTDPLRDATSSPVMGDREPLPLRVMPMLPPPVLHED